MSRSTSRSSTNTEATRSSKGQNKGARTKTKAQSKGAKARGKKANNENTGVQAQGQFAERAPERTAVRAPERTEGLTSSPPLQSATWLLAGAVLGLTGAYLMDPVLGRRRRALLNDQITHWQTTLTYHGGKKFRYWRNRVIGMSYKASQLLKEQEQAARSMTNATSAPRQLQRTSGRSSSQKADTVL